MIDLTDFKFNIPSSALIHSIVFTMEQCSAAVSFPWSVVGHLIRNGDVLGGKPVRADMNPAQVAQTCFAEQRRVELGGALKLWGLTEDIRAEDFDFTSFGIALQVTTSAERAARDDVLPDPTAASNSTTTTTTTATTTTATTTATTATATSSTAATTSTEAPNTTAATESSSTAAPTTTAPPSPGVIAFRKPQITIYYLAMCLMYEYAPARCSDDGESVVGAPVEIKSAAHQALTMPADHALVLEADEYLDEMEKRNLTSTMTRLPFLLVNDKVTVGGNLTLSFSRSPEEGVAETWFVIRTNTGNVDGRFAYLSANVTDLNPALQIAEDLCYRFDVTPTYSGPTFYVTTKRRNICLENARKHPGVVAAIVLGVLSVVFSAVALLVLWRKRRFDRSRAAMLSSPLSDESELQELRDGGKPYADTAKMIESTSGRFEIGDDDIDDPEL